MSTTDATLIRDGMNVLYRLAGGVVARIGPAGSHLVAERHLRASRWLADRGVPVVRTVDGVEQPTSVGGRPVTWWVRLPEHRPATPAELGATLRRLHRLDLPEAGVFPTVDPLEGLSAALDGETLLAEGDRDLLRDLADRLRVEYRALVPHLPLRLIHGDAWQGNVVVPVAGGEPVLLDLDQMGVGPPEWDLVSLAVDHTDFARITDAEYRAFVAAYGGYDMTTWFGYRTLATIRELRWATFVLGKARVSPAAAAEARHRVACLTGKVERP
ncbi:phosphotransferase enzyme family protein, partial [Actinoalloteichus spitiensis]|uniref:phosphotransferase enzyme family protein n=1 Tax=Actinoalloteichus spitiensis TaxID=252394 RepID=UPI00035FD3E2